MNSWLTSELRRRNTKYMDWEGRNEIIIVESLEFTSVQTWSFLRPARDYYKVAGTTSYHKQANGI